MLMQLLLVSMSLVGTRPEMVREYSFRLASLSRAGARQPVVQELLLTPQERYAHSMSVYIAFKHLDDPQGRDEGSSGTGSDAADGKSYVLTTAHGIGKLGTRVQVSAPRRNLFSSPRFSHGTVVGFRSQFDMNMDVAVILLDETHFFGSRLVNFQFMVPLKNTELLLSCCLDGKNFPTITNGIVPYRTMKGLMTPRFALLCYATPGASGGGVFTQKGEFVGFLWATDRDGDPEIKYITAIQGRGLQRWIRENNYPFYTREPTNIAAISSTPQQ